MSQCKWCRFFPVLRYEEELYSITQVDVFQEGTDKGGVKTDYLLQFNETKKTATWK